MGYTSDHMMKNTEGKSSMKMRKFSWGKSHSVKSNDVRLGGKIKRSGSMNNLAVGINKEFVKSEKKRRSSTLRLKKKFTNNNVSDTKRTTSLVSSHSSNDIYALNLQMSALSVLAPGVAVQFSVSHRK